MRRDRGVKVSFRGSLVVLAVSAILLGACQAGPAPSQGREKLVLAVLPTSNPQALSAESRELEEFLEDRVDADVEILVPTLYAGVVEALRFGHAQAAFLSAWPALLASQAAGAEVALAEVREVVIGEEKVERPFYYSYWVVRKESPVGSLAELKGKRAAFPSPLSTSGYVKPMARLLELGLMTKEPGKEVDPKTYFGDVFFAGGYAQAWEALKQGQVDVTVIAGDVPEVLYREVLANARVIEQQGPIPSHAVVFSKGLGEPLRTQLRDALLELGRAENRPLMRKFISAIFVGFEPRTTEEHLGPLRSSLQATGLQFTEKLALPLK